MCTWITAIYLGFHIESVDVYLHGSQQYVSILSLVYLSIIMIDILFVHLLICPKHLAP